MSQKVSLFDPAGALDGTEIVGLVKGGINERTTTAEIAALGGSGFVTPQQFQVSAGLALPLSGGVQDDSPAFVAAIAYLKTLGVNKDSFYQGSPRLFVPAGTYNMGTTTLDITHTLIIEGESSINGYATLLRWSGDATGIRIQAYNTSGASTVIGAGFNAGSYTILRSLGLAGPYYNNTDFTGHAEGEFHGIHARSNYIIEDCYVDGFAGDGVHVLTSSGGGGADEGNSNCSFINRLKVTNVRNGLFVDGADANAGVFTGIVGTYCRRWTVWDSSFLGNTHVGHHSANAGLILGVAPSIAVQGANRYGVIAGQEVGASTNAPSGTTADNQWWLFIGAGAAAPWLNIDAWVNGTTYRASGSYHTDSLNAYNNFIGCYQEGGEPPAQFTLPTCIIGGLWGTRNPICQGANWYAGHRCEMNNIFKLVPQNDPSPLENGYVWTASAGGKIKARLGGATVDLLNSGYTSPDFTTSITIGGTQVIAGRGAAVTAPTGGATIDTQARTAINDVIARLQAHGLIL